MIFNVLMVISGIGLMRMSEWARRLALAIAGLKILRWVAIVTFTMIVIVPMTTEMTQKLLQQVDQQVKAQGRGATPFPLASLSQFAAIASAVTFAVDEYVVFSIGYPLLSLWFLTRPATRAAILARAKPAGLPPELISGERL